MATLNSITVTPSAIIKGNKAAVSVGLLNADQVHKINGVDESGNAVTFTYTIHENLSFTVVPASQALAAGGKAPAGTMVFWTDDPAGGLSVDPTNPLALVLQT